MTSPASRRTLRTILAVGLAVGIAAAASPARAAIGESDRPRSLEGTWWVQVTVFTDCQAHVPLTSFSALLTFAKGGTLTGTTTNPMFAPGQRSPDHGIWSSAHAPRTYTAASVAFLAFAAGPLQAGSQRLDQQIELVGPNQFRSDAVSGFYDLAGQKYREVCAQASARRFE